MREPGDLRCLDEAGLRAWNAAVQRLLAATVRPGPDAVILPAPDGRTPGMAGPDWTGFPVRVATCLTRRRAQELLDWSGRSGCEGRQRLQEEYVEWRVVREASGAVRRVEFTTELAEYWRVLAAHDPAGTVATVALLAGEESVDVEAVYAGCDPFADGVSPAERERAFAARMLPPTTGAYNSGRRGICCMLQPTNTLPGLLRLVAAAAVARRCRDPGTGRLRWLTAAEAIGLFPNAAQEGRASDPVLVEWLGRMAAEDRHLAFDDPLGVYLVGVEHTRLRTPDGSPVPPDWFAFGRGVAPGDAVDGRARFQRLTVDVPAEHGFAVSDLVDVATGEPIRYGAQLAELVQVGVYFRVGPAGAVAADPGLVPCSGAAGLGCTEVRRHHDAFLADRDGEA